jgi:hypothetical protein
LSGLASIDFRQKAGLLRAVESALSHSSQTVNGAFRLSVGVKAAVQIITRCNADIKVCSRLLSMTSTKFCHSQNPSLRSIPINDSIFSTRIASDPAAILLLEAAGFQAMRNTTTDSLTCDGDSCVKSEGPVLSYDLSHNNAAILNLVTQVGRLFFVFNIVSHI